MSKQKSTFSDWQESSVSEREGIVKAFLAFLTQTRVRTAHLTDLAVLVAAHVAQVQDAPCSTSTLLRNIRYKSLLLTHMAERKTGGVNGKSISGGDHATQAIVLKSELQTGNAERELDRLKIYVDSLERQLDELKSTRVCGAQLTLADAGRSPQGTTDMELRFVRTCQALSMLLAHLGILISLDPTKRQILDSSKRRNNVIVDANLAAAFFDWIAAQPPS
jgi:hypothetical protein